MDAKRGSRPLLLAGMVAACLVVSATGQGRNPEASRASSPGESVSAGRGRHLFVQSCAHCHGDDAHGSGEDGDGPDLFGLRIGNARIAAVVRTGIPGEMPSFAKKHGSGEVV